MSAAWRSRRTPFLFNVPKLKTHNLSITTLAMKNLMGLVNVFDRHYCAQAWKDLPEEISMNPRPRSEWYDRSVHERWQEGLALRLADTARVIQPAVNLIEGIVGREGTGFQRGRNRPLGLAIAGVNLVAVDSLASYLMGFDPQSLIYLNVAARAGLGENDIRKLRVYTLQAGELALVHGCARPADRPSICGASGIMGEDPNLFRSEDQTSVDPVDRRAALVLKIIPRAQVGSGLWRVVFLPTRPLRLRQSFLIRNVVSL